MVKHKSKKSQKASTLVVKLVRSHFNRTASPITRAKLTSQVAKRLGLDELHSDWAVSNAKLLERGICKKGENRGEFLAGPKINSESKAKRGRPPKSVEKSVRRLTKSAKPKKPVEDDDTEDEIEEEEEEEIEEDA